jgi:hypothetical protein
MFSCFFLKKKKIINVDNRPIYNNNKDSVFTLTKRIKNEGYIKNESDNRYLEDNKEYIVLDEFDEFIRNILFNKLCILINYKKENRIIINNIDELRYDLGYKLRHNMLPVFFQTTKYLDTTDKLKDIIYNKIHIDNIKTLNIIFNPNRNTMRYNDI